MIGSSAFERKLKMMRLAGCQKSAAMRIVEPAYRVMFQQCIPQSSAVRMLIWAARLNLKDLAGNMASKRNNRIIDLFSRRAFPFQPDLQQ